MKACPNCKGSATKIIHMSADDKAVECQQCGHRYDEHERVAVATAPQLPSEPPK